MHAAKETLSPTLAYMLNVIKQDELEKAEKRGNKEAKINFAEKLIKENFPDEKIAELTGIVLQEVVELRKSLQD